MNENNQISYIQNSLGTKFQLKLTILNFWTKLTQNRYFHSKKEKKMKIIKFYISEIAYVQNFSFNK